MHPHITAPLHSHVLTPTQNQEFREHPERYKGLEQSLQEGDGESSPKLASRLSGHKRKESSKGLFRHGSVASGELVGHLE